MIKFILISLFIYGFIGFTLGLLAFYEKICNEDKEECIDAWKCILFSCVIWPYGIYELQKMTKKQNEQIEKIKRNRSK